MLRTVITTIFRPSAAVLEHARHAAAGVHELVVVADRKTPADAFAELSRSPGCRLLTLDAQARLAPDLAGRTPLDHYARKNLGYVAACHAGAAEIFDTDDDTAPLGARPEWHQADTIRVAPGGANGAAAWFNVYAMFGQPDIWPRGFPLDRILAPHHARPAHAGGAREDVAVWQGLVDHDPDVDAIYRLTRRHDNGVRFSDGPAVILEPQVYCPFNSQNTWWIDPSTFWLLYLPVTVTSRVSDILRSYVAQRCLWSRGRRVGFLGATARHHRHPHHLLRDFADETTLYLRGGEIPAVVEAAAQRFAGTSADLVRCYEALAAAGVVGSEEPRVAQAWLEAIDP